MDFEVKRCTRRCATTQRELEPGELFYAALIPSGGEVVRLDYCVEAWEAPPEHAIGWWKSRMADPNVKKVDWAPSDVILDYFRQLQDQPQELDTRYVLCLLMIRRRLLRLEDTERSEAGEEQLIVFSPQDESEYRVVVTNPTPERIEIIQDRLASLLFGATEIVESTNESESPSSLG